MRTTARQILALITLTLMCSTIASAELYHVEVDLATLGIDALSDDFELEVALYDNALFDLDLNIIDSSVGNSRAFLDNVNVGSATDDFTDDGSGGASREGFDPWSDPDFVIAEVDPLSPGNHVLRIDSSVTLSDGTELISSFPVYAVRDYFTPGGSVLSFDLETALSPEDELVFSLLDPDSLDPLISGLSAGYADFLALGEIYGDTGVGSIAQVDVNVVPLPGASVLAVLGFGAAGLKLRRRK